MTGVRIEWDEEGVLRGVGAFVEAALNKTVAGMATTARELEEPFADTGNLVNNIGFDPATRTPEGWTASLRSDAPYSLAVNNGHHLRNGEWWEGRHFMEEAWDRNVPGFKQALGAAGFQVR